ncbi:FscD [Streptomyces griseus]|uniref:FscD n=1 Tax=Streptomyces griseus TaxID=1911 RepID=A0A380N868_STRGR|nr:FscD [Streptomyces griseus]
MVSGDEDAVTALAEEFAARGRKTRRLRVSHAFHSLHMDAMLQDFERVTRSVSYTPPKLPLVSNLTGGPATDAQVCDPRYWVEHVRGAVRFGDGVRTLAVRGATRYLESAPTESSAASPRRPWTPSPTSTAPPPRSSRRCAPDGTRSRP